MNITLAAPMPSVANSPSDTSKFNPSMAIIIAVLITGMLVVVSCSIYIRGRTRSSTDRLGQIAGHSNRPVDFYERPGQGLERSLVESLPEVSFAVVKTMKAGKDSLECAVCLERFEEDENLRLLPKCSHVFHSECIDVWFHSHSTCPLCRSSLLPTFSEINAGVPAIGDVSRRILQAQEEAYGSARSHVSGDEDASAAADGDLPQGGSESGRRIARMNERNSARLALFRNSNSFGRAARGVEVRERLAAESARYPASIADIDRQPRRASSLNCVNFSLPRSESLNASGSRGFVHGEVFQFGSQRFGAPGVPLRSSLGRTDSSNSGFEPQRVADFGNKNLDARLTAEGSSSPGSSSHGWANIELQSTEARNMTMNARVYPAMGLSKSLELDPGQVLATNVVQLGTTRKSGSGPLSYGKISNDKTGRPDQRSSKTERAGSFSSLRGSFSLYRSSSDGRLAQVFATDQGPPVPSSNVDANIHASSRPNVAMAAAGSAEIGNGRTPSFARRTMQWLAGHHRKESSSGAAPTDSGSGLQEIVTQE